MTERVWIKMLGLSITMGLIGGCGGGEDLGSYEGFNAAYAARLCDQRFRCDTDGYYAPLWRATTTDAACRRALEAEGLNAAIEEDLARGLVRYDRAAAEACLGSFDAVCAGGNVTACSRALVGTMTVGGSCTSGAQCASRRCSAQTPVECGACLETVGDGEPCVLPTQCAEDSECLGTCRLTYVYPTRQSALGDECGYTDENDYLVCPPSLYCDEDFECRQRLRIGQRCEGSLDSCETGSICDVDEDGDERCLPIVIERGEGDDCGDVDGDVVLCDRTARLYCQSGVCERLPGEGEIGDECNDEYDCESGRCALDPERGDLRCIAGDLPAGARCASDGACASGYCSPFTVGCEARATCP